MPIDYKGHEFGFFPADLCDGLQAMEQAVLAWLWFYRSRESGSCFPSHARLARHCGCTRSTIIRTIKALEERGYIWTEPRVDENGRKTSNSYHLLLVRRCSDMTHACSTSDTYPHVSPADTNIRDSRIDTGSKVEPGTTEQQYIAQAEGIYQIYPRKVGKKRAIKAIIAALKSGTEARLLSEKVSAFAEAVEGQEPRFIPHPATWFNDGRFEDDEAEWSAWKRGKTNERERRDRSRGEYPQPKEPRARSI